MYFMIDYSQYTNSFKKLIEEKGRELNLIESKSKQNFINYIVAYVLNKIDSKMVDFETITELDFIKKYISQYLSSEINNGYDSYLKRYIEAYILKHSGNYNVETFKITSTTPNFWTLLNTHNEVIRTKVSKPYIGILKEIIPQKDQENQQIFNSLMLFYISSKQTDLSDLIIKSYLLS